MSSLPASLSRMKNVDVTCEENIGKLSRQLKKTQERCADGDRDACEKAKDIRDQIEDERGGG